LDLSDNIEELLDQARLRGEENEIEIDPEDFLSLLNSINGRMQRLRMDCDGLCKELGAVMQLARFKNRKVFRECSIMYDAFMRARQSIRNQLPIPSEKDDGVKDNVWHIGRGK